MLVIKSANPTGLFSYGRSPDIDVQRRGLVNLIGVNEDKGGDSNGAGKTSLFNALCEVLFGDNPTGVNGNEVVNQVLNEGYAGRVTFSSWEGVDYRVTYCRGWKEDYYPVDNNTKTSYKGTALFFDKLEGSQWVDCRGATMAETRTLVQVAVGVTYSRFLSISYLSHRVGSTFLRGTNKDRMDIMAGITGVEDWDEILVSARAKKLAVGQDISSVQQRIAYDEGALEQMRSALSQLKSADWGQVLIKCDLDTASAQDQLKLAEDHRLKLQNEWAARKITQTEAYNRSGSGVLSQEISDLSVQLSDLKNPMFADLSLPEFDLSFAQRVENKRGERDMALGELRALVSGKDLRSVDKCPTCGATISAKAKASITEKITGLESRASTLEVELKALTKAKNEEEERIRQARALRHRERLQQAVSVEAQIAEKKALLRQSALEYERITGEMQALEVEGRKAHELCTQYTQRISQIAAYKDDVEKRLGEIQRVEHNVAEREEAIVKSKASISEALEDVKVLEWIISNIPYIKLHRMSVAMTQLSEKVNHYLSEMGDTIRVNITSFEEKKAKKGAGDIKDALKSEVKVEVVDGEKNIDPRLYSDGETSKISNAVIRSLHDIAVQAGHGCNLVLLDEIFSFVDANNSQKLADSFNDVSTGTTFITDNSGHVEDLMDFDEVWIARKSGGVTTIEVR
jgi:DNA repair exonuclease SbcCD ATPase subunit